MRHSCPTSAPSQSGSVRMAHLYHEGTLGPLTALDACGWLFFVDSLRWVSCRARLRYCVSPMAARPALAGRSPGVRLVPQIVAEWSSFPCVGGAAEEGMRHTSAEKRKSMTREAMTRRSRDRCPRSRTELRVCCPETTAICSGGFGFENKLTQWPCAPGLRVYGQRGGGAPGSGTCF